jgi:predicted aconitase with swiveling domain
LTLLILKGRRIVDGIGSGKALVTSQRISFFGGVNHNTGLIIEDGHELENESVSGRVLIFPGGKGSTVGSYTLYALAKNRKQPSAIINVETEPIIAGGCALARIPLVDRLDRDPLKVIQTGDYVEVDGFTGIVKVARKLY